MTYWDQHCHSEFSFDSVEKIEHYLNIANHDIVTTEHLDIHAPNIGTVACDYDAYAKKLEELKKQTGFSVYRGIEVGYADHSVNALRRYLEGKSYDIHLLSVHEAKGKYDFMTPFPKRELGEEKTLELYYECCLQAIDTFPDFDVFTHIDCPFRVFPYDEKYKAILDWYLPDICKALIKNDIALELNTRSMYQYKNIEYYRLIVSYYKKAGGQYFSLGSDAHSKEFYEYHFREALEFMMEENAPFLVQFTKNKKEILEVGEVYENYRTKS